MALEPSQVQDSANTTAGDSTPPEKMSPQDHQNHSNDSDQSVPNIQNHNNPDKSQDSSTTQNSDDEKNIYHNQTSHLSTDSPAQGHQKSPVSLTNSDKAASNQNSSPSSYTNQGSLFGANGTPQTTATQNNTPKGYNQGQNPTNPTNGTSVSPSGLSTFHNQSNLQSPDPKHMSSTLMHSFNPPSVMQQNKLPSQPQPKQPSTLGATQYTAYHNFSPYNQQQYVPSTGHSGPNSIQNSISPMPPSNSLPPPVVLPQFSASQVEPQIPADAQFQQSMKAFQTNRLTPNSNTSLGPIGGNNKVRKAEHRNKAFQDRPYKCDHPKCEWAFTRASDLKRHLKSHNTPNYHCPYWKNDPTCHRNGGAFNRLDVLKRHLKLVHYIQDKQDLILRANNPKDDPGWCRSCQRMFQNSKLFIDHCQECSRMIPPSKWQHQNPPQDPQHESRNEPMNDPGAYNDHESKGMSGRIQSNSHSPAPNYPGSKGLHHQGNGQPDLMNYGIKENHDFLNDPNNNLLTLSSVINEFETDRKKE